MKTMNFLILSIFLLLIPVLMCYSIIGLHIAFGQTPTTTLPSPNPQYLPQKAYIQVFPPDGVSVTPVRESNIFSSDGIMGLISGLLSGGAGGIYAKLRGDKNQKTVQEVAQTQVKITDAQLQTNQQVFQNMEDKGASITDKPAIKVAELQKTKDQAVETASKA